MTRQINSLWPREIRADVRSPYAVLREQATALNSQTSGVLLGDIERREAEDGRVLLNFDIVVPALENYRYRILQVSYRVDRPYPAQVEAEVFRPKSIVEIFETQTVFEPRKPKNRADNDEEFVELVSQVLRSPQVVSTAQSLIARSDEALAVGELEKESKSPSIDNEDPESDDAG